MMKKLALSLLKSADEKLRNISAKQSNSKTSAASPPNPPGTSKSPSQTIIQSKSASLDTHKYNPKDSNTIMSERGVQRTNVPKHITEDQKPEVKRRTRSEGPAGRVKARNSVDEKKFLAAQEKKQKSSRHYQRKKQQEKGLRHSMYTEPLSDEGGFPDFRGSSSESELDNNDPKKWVKNPLIVKKQKKSEKRRSSYENDTGSKENDINRMDKYNQRNLSKNTQDQNHEPYVYQEKNGNGPQKAKYQRLEELRKKRIDITVTSDEELNSPEFRISRLRQRALQGAKLSTKLPDMLDDWNTGYRKHESVTPVEVKRAEHIRDMHIENGSSSSEQITLRQIGPGIRGNTSNNPEQVRRIEITNNKTNSGPTGNTNQNVGTFYRNDVTQKQNVIPQGSYRKIPKQDKDYGHVQNIGYDDGAKFTGSGSDPYNVIDPQVIMRKHQAAGVNPFSVDVQTNEYYRKQNIPGTYSETNPGVNQAISFRDVKTNDPMAVKKAIDRVDKKRKSNSDDDSLDDLIESNIQYLESEIESGKLKKLSSNQPAMFPVSPQESHTPISVAKKSSTRETISKPEGNTFQNEVKLRLQIPVVPQRPSPTNYSQYTPFEPVKSNKKPTQSSSPSSVSRLTPPLIYYPNVQQNISFQNTVPKTERKYTSATHSPHVQRRGTDLSEMEDLSKSDSQINTSETGFSYQRPSNFLNPQFQQIQRTSTETRQYTSHLNNPMTMETMIKSNSVPAMESGMFSDVDYDIEVTDRIKKWENFMKKKNVVVSTADGKQAVSLSTIIEGDGANWQFEPQTAVPVPQTIAVSSVSVTVTKATSLPVSRTSPPPQITTKTYFEPKVKSTETKSHRIFRVVQDPRCSQTAINPQESNLNWVSSPLTNKTSPTYISQSQAEQKYFEEPVLKPNLTSKQGWPPTTVKPNTTELKMARLSRIEDEFNELQDIKAESVKDLRRKFDSDASGNESTDLTDTPATPIRMTPLRQRKQYIKIPQQPQQPQKTPENYERPPQPPIRVYERKIEKVVVEPPVAKTTDAEVWSPNLESKKGLVSIERVKARTLQTIPFSEDPIWKQIEEMTNIDQLVGFDNFDMEEMPHIQPRSSIPNHRNSLVNICSSYEQTIPTSTSVYSPAGTQEVRMSAKPFVTPKIQPLKLSVQTKSSVDALDEVLEDIRSSLQKKQISPGINKTRQDDLPESTSSQSPSVTSKATIFYPPRTNEVSQTHINKQNAFFNPDPVIPRPPDLPTKSSESFPQSLKRQSMQPAYTDGQQLVIDPDFTQFPYIINGNYQLDPQLLKERLLDTGLAEEISSISECEAAPPSKEPPTPPERGKTTQSQVLQSMEDLRKLAEDVEDKLREIKTKIIQSDENKLDSIILALRKFSPSINPKFDPQMIVNKAEHNIKREKLQDALSELERIYDSLDLNSETLLDKAERQEYTAPKTETKCKEEHVKPTMVTVENTSNNYAEESVAEVERQTQQEFEDINKSFQSLLADFSQTDEKKPHQKSNLDSEYIAEIDATIDTFLEEFRKSEKKGGDAISAAELKRQFSRGTSDSKSIATQNTCREVMKSEVFTACSGPFSVLVGINGNCRNQRPVPKDKPARNYNQKLTRSQSDSMKDSQSMSEKYISAAVATAEPKASRSSQYPSSRDEGSESDEKASRRVPRRFGRNPNLQHRKSMPADMLKKSVETQTVDPNWVSPVAAMREKFQTGKERDDSLSSESSSDVRGPRRRKIAKGIAMMMEFFSSSEDERGRKSKLSHSHSAPDLRDVFTSDSFAAKPASPILARTKTPRAVKQRHEARARKRSTEMCQKEEKGDDFSVTSATSDDGSQMSGTKPPLHPGLRKQKSFSPERSESVQTSRLNSVGDSKEDSQTVSDSESKSEVILRKKNCERSESPERPHSFHELLATFERDPDRIDKLRHSLRKCASADAITDDTISRKSYSSEPDLSKALKDRQGVKSIAKLDVEIRLKS